MIKKIIKCNDITFESINDILKYKKAGIDHSWHITPNCIEEIKKVYTELYNKIEDPDNIIKTANEILIGLDKMLEDAKICKDALKMNALMQNKNNLKVDVTDDMDDEAEEIINRETKKLMENDFIDENGFVTTNVAKEVADKIVEKYGDKSEEQSVETK
jgi:hypothetical protein